ncbi:MAG: glycosyltransferase family 9 protein, partial [Candidatus Omnitrophota bacterium]
GIDDELKFRKNQKTYQTISFEQAGLRFEGQEYLFLPTPRDVEIASKHLKKIGADPGAVARPVIGINTGSGVKFAGKRLEEAAYVRLAAMLGERLGATIFLLGGQDEIQRNHSIQRQIAGKAFDTGSHTIGQFAGIVSFCDLVITGDTTAMHVAIALKVPTVVCFGSTCAAEIELYGRGFKIVSKLACAPCYKKACPIGEACMAQTDLGLIAAAAEQLLNRPRK